jgi:hypothetical protein
MHDLSRMRAVSCHRTAVRYNIMGMKANILATGPLSREIIHALPYSTSRYVLI